MDDSEVGMLSTSSPIFEEKPGGVRLRFAASFFDSMILAIPLYLTYSIEILFVQNFGSSNNTFIYLIYLIFLLATLFYFVYFAVKNGATPGKRIYGLKIVDIRTKNNVSYKSAFLRYLTNRFMMSLPLIGFVYGLINFIVILSSDQRRGLHDKLSQSQVLIVKRSWPLWKQFGLFIILILLLIASILLPITRAVKETESYESCTTECIETMEEYEGAIRERYRIRDECLQECREGFGF